MRIYLAGCTSYYDNPDNWHKAIDWRKKATAALLDSGNKVFDPTVNWHTNSDYDSNLMVIQNEYYLKNSDLLLVNLDDLDKSYGTIFEIITAHHLNIPIIAFGENYITTHPHINHCIDSIFLNLDNALNFIFNTYCQ